MGYTKDAVKGVGWLGGFRVVSRGISFLRTAIVARILSPSQFGVFSIATLVLSFLEIFTETGINIFLVQQNDQADDYINTAWIVSIIRGFIISLCILISSPYIAAFFKSSTALQPLQLISLVPIIRGFINPSVAKFIKDLEFHKEFYYRTILFLVESIFSIMLIYYLHTPSGLVGGLIAGALVEVVLSMMIAYPRPQFIFDPRLFRTVIYHGKWLTLGGIFNYLYHNADNIVVGRILGTASLGLYDMAYKISMLPISEVTDVIGKATFPVYVKIASDVQRVKSALFKSLIAASLVTIPLGLIIFLFPELIIMILLGDRWLSAAPVLRALAVFGTLRSLMAIPFNVFYGIGRQDIITLVTFISLLGMMVTIFPFIHYFGLIGASAAVLCGTIIAMPILVYQLVKVLRNK